ncbi:hypothetical protein HPB50_027033 [Hyalomma asiaticum]|uniref:Uncharacterized protein n=1 Tax=Hyalomma asiaticum TaxID=266040 RepID=A0ACB7RPR2_HYAAI|nr:hypothetical protein HPB50_027033 [Hyalomma asiaticum]
MHCPGFAARQFHVLSSLANRTTEFIWQRTLPHLRALIPKKPGTSGNFIHTFADVTLPDFARRVLSMGPKFAVPPRSTGNCPVWPMERTLKGVSPKDLIC